MTKSKSKFKDSLTDVCSNGYKDLLEESKYCYRHVKIYQDFRTARANCEKDGGELATFHNENEENFFGTDAYDHYTFGYRRLKIEEG